MRLRDWSSDVCSSDHQRRHRWPGLKTVVMLESTREIGVKIEHETRLYISSLALQAERFGAIVRSHWAIENSLPWVMDLVLRDEERHEERGGGNECVSSCRSRGTRTHTHNKKQR